MLGQPEKALQHVQKAIASDGNNARAHASKGLILAGQEMYDEAIAAYRTALGIQPADGDARFNLGEALRLSKRYDDAISEFGKLLQFEPGNGLARQRIGEIQMLQGKNAEAKATFTRLLSEQPGYAQRAVVEGHLKKL